MQFAILGPLDVSVARRSIELSATLERALLLRLLVTANVSVSLEELIEDLWEGDPPASAVRTLRVYVSRLRRALGEKDRIRTTPEGYLVRVEPGECDAEHFETLAGRGQLSSALELWRGHALADVAEASWAVDAAAGLEARRLEVLEARVREDVAMGRLDSVVPELEALCARFPQREGLWSSLMLARYLAGRYEDALAAYDLLAARLEDHERRPPHPELRFLRERILAAEAELTGAPDTYPASPLARLVLRTREAEFDSAETAAVELVAEESAA